MDLRDHVLRARSGYRSDVAALGEALGRGDVFVPLARSAGVPEGRSTLAADADIALHSLPSADGTSWVPLFTSRERLLAAGMRNGWTTDGGPLHFVGMPGMTALTSVFAPSLEAGATAGVVFDVGHDSELAMNAAEVLRLIRGEAIPLVGYASRLPARGTEKMLVGEPATPPSHQALDRIAAVLGTEPSVEGWHLRQVFTPERDVQPHLLLDIRAAVTEQERRRISEKVGAIVGELQLPPPGYLDVAFNLGGASEPA